MKNNRYIAAMVGLLLMMGASTTAYGQIVKGKVFGGGQLAQVNGQATKVNGDAADAACSVTINSGSVYGEVYGAGEGLKSYEPNYHADVAKVTGDTKVHLGTGRGGGGTAWRDIFGGGALARVAGDTYVSMSGGHIAANLFGGGMGDIKMNGDVYDRTDGLKITSADITGNTNVDITGGDIIWNRTSSTTTTSSSKTTYTYTKTVDAVVENNISYVTTLATADAVIAALESEGYTSVTASQTSGPDGEGNYTYTVSRTTPGYTLVVTSDTKRTDLEGYTETPIVEDNSTVEGEIVWWNPDENVADGATDSKGNKCYNSKFYDATKKKFLIKHNIFGGGYVACRVGTYNASGEIQNKKDGEDNPLLDAEGNVIPTGRARVSMVSGLFGVDLMSTQQWKDCYNDNQDPHFYVFGGGLGAFTSVGKTQVQIGVDEEILEAAGETDEQWAKPHRKNAPKKVIGGTTDDPVIDIADQQYGEPGYTVLGVLGGGYAGIVTGNTDVRVGGNTFMHRIYGGGYGQLAAYNELVAGDNICKGIPTWNISREDLGMVMGNTYVKTDGGFIQGDVFGGGAGVESAWLDGTTYKELDNTNTTATKDFTMGEVKGATEVEITGATFVQRSVYGGGDVANVLGGTVDTEDENAPQQTSTVTVKSGTVVANVFGGGNGRLVSQVYAKEDDGKAVTVGKIVGETLVTIEDTKNDETGEIISSPYIYGDIYGGCGYGQIVKTSDEATDGNTFVNINGGNIGGNVYGGGLGKEETNNTSANIAGSTNVTINGGSALWDQISDDNGNISKWDVSNVLTTEADKQAVRVALVTGNTQIFKKLLNGKVNEKFFDVEKLEYTKNHNIYGGGDRVCKVAGKANVTVNHALITDAVMLDPSNSAGLCWSASIDNKEHPQFSIFGGGYGPNTTVAAANVNYQCGKKETVYTPNDPEVIAGTKHPGDHKADYDYLSQAVDRESWTGWFRNLVGAWTTTVTNNEKELYYGGNNQAGIWRYAVSQLAWSPGIPNLIMRGIFGGGYAGFVTGNTNVIVSDFSCMRYIYGGGLGSKDYLDKYNTNTGTNENPEYLYQRLGEVGGNASVVLSGGVVSKEVYGGGAGIEPKKLGDDTDYTDLVDMARIKGKTSVTISGSPTVTAEGSQGTLVMGDVFGAGDVANVGMKGAEIYGTSPINDLPEKDKAKYNYITSQVNINSGCMLGQVFAGGNGRTKDICNNYINVGAVYGNTLLAVDGFDEGSSQGNETQTGQKGITYIFKRMFGGGNNGSVRKTTGNGGADYSGHTYVSVNGGYFAYNVFGGGVGTINVTKDDVTGEVLEDNNTYSYVEGDTHVKMLGGLAIVDQYWDKPQKVGIAPGDTIEVGMRQWAPLNEKDGKNYSAQYDPEQKKLLINHNVYAGCRNAGYVLGNTYLTMNKGYIRSSLRAGTYDGVADNFFVSQEWEEIYSKIGSPHFCIFGGGFGENTHIKGDTFVDISIDATDDNLGLQSAEELKDTDHERPASQRFEGGQSVMDIIGGGYSGDVAGATHVKVSHDVYARRIFGGSFYAPVSQTNVLINSINCDDVFGGGMMGDVKKIEGTTLADAACGNTNVVIGTPGAPANDKIFINNNVYGGNDVSGEVTGQITASIFGGKIYNNVYGAGNGNYLYALNDKMQNVTAHEYYEANGQTYDLVYEVPKRPEMDFSVTAATDAQKIVNINTYRPRAEKVVLNIGGTLSKPLSIDGNVFGGGNTATVSSLSGNRPSVTINIGSYCTIGGVYMGADGEAMFQEKSGFMGAFQNINGVDLTNPIDWVNNVANKQISEEFLPVAKANRNKVYPHVLDLYFEPVEMSVQPTLNWCNNITLDDDKTLAVTATPAPSELTNTTIGTFVSGGNRGNMNVEPWKFREQDTENHEPDDEYTAAKTSDMNSYGGNINAEGQVVNYSFPSGLTIQNRIVGGCNNANYTLGNVTHEGGYLLGGREHEGTEINLFVKCQFAPQATAEQVAAAKENSEKIAELSSGNIFGGCYKSGTINGDVLIDMRSDMLKNVNADVLTASKANNVPVASVYGAGYGMESYVHGNTEVLFGKGTKSTTSSSPAKPFGPKKSSQTVVYGATAKDVYGGGQQGNLIGNSTIKILNGHIAGSVVGGSYAGYMWGSTQVLVGYPKYYTVNRSGTYDLKRADKWSTEVKNHDLTTAVKYDIKLIEGDIIAEEVYDAIVEHTPGKSSDFTEYTMRPSVDSGLGIKWDDIIINIGDAAYGGGYSLGSGSVGSQTYTVLKYNDEQNLDDMPSNKLDPMGGSSKGYGGNTTVLVWDHASDTYSDGSTDDKEHIAISSQEMTEVNLPVGADLFGYYYKDTQGNYKFIFQEGQYKKGSSDDIENKVYQYAYKYEGDGGVYGDGHLSFAEGFRAGEVNGYGFAGSNPNGAKILNTFQRMDMLRVTDCSLVLLGACDYTVNQVSTTPYSIARIGELQMKSPTVKMDGTSLYPLDQKRSRNFVGLSNNIHYVGAVTSDVLFNHPFHDRAGVQTSRTYREEKQDYVDKYYGKGSYTTDETQNPAYSQKGIFQRRNDGTAKNMIGIASGYAMKIQNTKTTGPKTEEPFYGPIIGVVEVALTNTHADEAGAYVYAANLHHRPGDEVPLLHSEPEDFLETTGNFVFPYNPTDNRYVIDDCYKVEYDAQKGKQDGEPTDEAEAHYWYVAGWDYYFNAHITGYNYSTQNTFYAQNDGTISLVGTIPSTKVKIESIKWHSNHNNADGFEDELEVRNTKSKDINGNVDAAGNDVAGAYKLYLATSDAKQFATDGAFFGTIADKERTPHSLSFVDNTTSEPLSGQTKDTEDNIHLALQDDADNHSQDYFKKHLSQPCKATILLSAPAYNVDDEGNRSEKYKYAVDYGVRPGNDIPSDHYVYNDMSGEYEVASGKAAEGKAYFTRTVGRYTYTIYLTIEYVMGPDYTGNISVENCALPGEMIKVTPGNLTIVSNPSMPPYGFNWKFGPRTFNSETNKWEMDYSKAYTYKIGSKFNPEAESNETSEMLAGVKYNKDGDYIEVPAYYFMNGYGVEYNFNVTGINDVNGDPQNFPVEMRDQDMLTVHNYHRAKPRNADGINRATVDFHLDLAAQRAADDAAAVAAGTMQAKDALPEPRIYIADAADLNEFARFVEEKAPLYYDYDGYNKGKSDAEKLTQEQFDALPSTKKLTGEYGAEGSMYNYGKNMQFHLLDDITIRMTQEDHYGELDSKKVGTAAHGFKGTLNGNGYVISGFGKKTGDFTAPTYLFDNTTAANFKTGDAETMDYNIYNLGVVEGKIMKGDNSTTGNDNYHCSYSWADKVVYRMDGTAVATTKDGANNTYTENDWRYGKVTYDLNQYYLEARKANLNHTADAQHYVEDLFHNGDYLYARWKTASDEYLRTADASQYDANYNSATSYHYYTLTDGVLTHPVDESRAVYETVDEVTTFCHYAPLYEADKQNSTLATSEVVKNDFLFFGQKLNAATKKASTGEINVTIPEHIDSDVKHDVSLMKNRVYRAGGYYKSNVAFMNNGKPEDRYDTNAGAFFYNREAYAHDNGITAIDYYGYKNPTVDNYNPVVDYPTAKLASMSRADGVTRNLLVYANNVDDVNEGGALKTYIYDDNTLDDDKDDAIDEDVEMHVIKPVITPAAGSEPEKVTPTTELFHLVERTSADKNASGKDCPNNDFDCPVAFDVTDHAWYVRVPAGYRNRKPDERMWEGIVLPFTAKTVTAILQKERQGREDEGIKANGMITHFYGNEDQHHEYWLRGLKAARSDAAWFYRPGTSETASNGDTLFSTVPQQKFEKEYTFINDYFAKLSSDLPDEFKDKYNTKPEYGEYYEGALSENGGQKLSNYVYLTKEIPYIVAFPGNDYYEFSMEGDVMYDVTRNLSAEGSHHKSGMSQYARFEAPTATIQVSDAVNARTTTVDGTAHKGTYLAMNDADYAINGNGNAFDDDVEDVLPFRTYMSKTSGGAAPHRIYILENSNDGEDGDNDDDMRPAQDLSGKQLTIEVRGLNVIAHSTFDDTRTVSVYRVNGQLVHIHKAPTGESTFTLPGEGLYIINGKKIAAKD